jgi:glycosyltransferase involved in cell wall biosynthesis
VESNHEPHHEAVHVQPQMKVMVLGVRGIPSIQGGVETHAEQLYPRLAQLGCDVEVLVRTPFVPRDHKSLGTIRLRRIWAPKTSGWEAMVHSLLGVLYAAFARPDVLHIHAIGPAIVTPLARFLGLRVVVTNHGPDYERDKWGAFPKWVLRTGERLGMRSAHARIAISRIIAGLVRDKYGSACDLIPNGAVPVELESATEVIERLGLQPGRYVLHVGRIVAEKRQLDLIEAFTRAKLPGWKLALIGTGGGEYGQRVKAAAAQHGVVLGGFQRGRALAQLYSHAGMFVLPSSHEGLPIALLEALSYGLPVLASDIPANLDMGLPAASYFPLGDVEKLAGRLTELGREPISDVERENRRVWVTEHYDWGRIAKQTLDVYNRVLQEPKLLRHTVL